MKSYTELFETGYILKSRRSIVEWYYHKLVLNRPRYEDVARRVGSIPWWVVGVIHQLESSFNFSTHLHNGDPLSARTKHVPAGRPRTGRPPFKWVDSAVDALQLKRAENITHWSLEITLGFLERYNGLGYRYKGINTPYLWSYTNHYVKGRYVRDGVFDPESVSKQAGAVASLYMLIEKGDVDRSDLDPLVV